MPTSISVSKVDYGYLVTVQRSGYRGFTEVIESHQPSVAADATIAAWRDMEADPDGVTVNLPQGVEVAIQVLRPLPWLTGTDK
jgi:hypothetical protein